MEKYFTHDLIIHIIGFQSIILLIIFSNIWITRRARMHPPLETYPLVSILVPARNEEKNITTCVQSLLAQTYPSFELLVLDDQSTDNTYSILEEISTSNPNLTVLEGQPPSEDQVGKNWACTQLANQAQGDLFLFTDADTFHQPNTLKELVNALVGEQADLITGFPYQQVHSWGEKLLVPFFSWALTCFIPLWVSYRFRLHILTSAVGQMMLFQRAAYFSVGGHNNVSSSIVDDLSLARHIKSTGLRCRVVYITDLISCRMYKSSREACNGFVKNLFAAFEFRLLPYLFVFSWLVVVFWLPLIIISLMSLNLAPQAQSLDLSICIGLSLLVWLIPYLEMRIPFGLAFLYPVTMLANFIIALQSLRYSLSGGIFWKGRKIMKSRWRWL